MCIRDSLNSNGLYTVTVTDNNQCTATATATVASSSPPTEERMQNIPTMSQWGLIIYGLLVLNVAVFLLGGLYQLEEMG